MNNSIISYLALVLWGFGSHVTKNVWSINCPSRDIYIPTAHELSPPADVLTPTELWAYPFVVSLIEQHSVTKLYRHLCGGVIVNLGVVLTACSCVGEVVNGATLVHERCTRLIVLAGTPDIYMKTSAHKQVETPSKCKLHRRCDLTKNMTADVGLIFLQRNLTLTTHTKPMKVFSMDHQTFKNKLEELTQLGTFCYQPGWSGDTIYYGVKPNVVGWIDEEKRQLIKRRKCREMHCIFEDEGPSCRSSFVGGFCATSFQGKPPVVADTGGPLMCHGWMFGITSIPSCDSCSPTVYAGPSLWLELIWDFIPDNSPFIASGAQFSRSFAGAVICTSLLALHVHL